MASRSLAPSPVAPSASGLGFQPEVGPLVGRMAFVPEGQVDRSQARSAWVAMQRAPVPEGPVEVMPRSVQPSRWDGLFPHDSRHFVPGYYRALPTVTPELLLVWMEEG
jgi:hypothetical protein